MEVGTVIKGGGFAGPRRPTLVWEHGMIALTRLNGHPVMVNSDLIEQIEETPDTVVTLTSGNRLVVRDRMLEIQQKIVDFKRRIYGPA
jgi:flagellar protein FlbD